MHENILDAASRLSDDALLARLKSLAGREREATVELVAHLAELDTRTVHLGEGVKSLWGYCTRILHLSEDAACSRVAAAKAVRMFPVILDLMADGSVHLTTVKLLAPHLTPENHRALLAEATHRSRSDVEVIVRRLSPLPDVRPTIRKLPSAELVSPVMGDSRPSSPATAAAPWAPVGAPPAEAPRPAAHRPVISPLAPERYRLQITMAQETHDTLRRLQDLLAREVQGGDPAVIVARALAHFLREVETKKIAATDRPRPPRATKAGSRHVPAAVRRAVWTRDGAQCAFNGRSGRCAERRFLEWHHLRPHGHQGPATVDNISLRCRAHNVYESELVFGRFDPSCVRETSGDYVAFGNVHRSRDR
jgi:hypothetical protein